MSLHPIQATELEMIRAWRNAPAVRQAMYSHHEITPEEHQVWFQRLQHLPSARWYLYRDAAGQAPGRGLYSTALDPAQGIRTTKPLALLHIENRLISKRNSHG